jgi:membrane protein implicated in regulation of membrane protease activity
MADWTMWLIVAGVLIIAELFSGTFYVLMIAIGMGFGALAALAGLSVSAQIATAAVVGIAATSVLHRSRFGAPARGDTTRDPNVNIDIGQTVEVAAWEGNNARVMYRGAPWDVELAPGASPEAGSYTIVAVHGSRLVLGDR